MQSTVFPNKIEHKIAGQVSVMFFCYTMNAYVMTLHLLIGHLLLRWYTISHDDDDDGGGDNDNVCKGSIMTCLLIYGFCILQKCR